MLGTISELEIKKLPSSQIVTVIFPHAGGSPRFYRHWQELFGPEELWGVTYPARDSRIDEAPSESLVVMAYEIYREILSRLPGIKRLILVGHSMGGWLAYEVAQLLCHDAEVVDTEVVLVVSCQYPPHLRRGTRLHLASDDELVDDVLRRFPANAEVWESEELRKIFLPIIREDYRLVETYDPSMEFVDQIIAVCASEDDEIECDAMDEWQSYSRRRLVCHRLNGNHFYLSAPDLRLARIVRESAYST